MDKAKNEALMRSPSTTNKDGFVFKWEEPEGSFEELKSFVETTLSLTGTWSSLPKANAEKFTTNSKSKMDKSISITFHIGTKTLQIQGNSEDVKELKAFLLELTTPRNSRKPANDESSSTVQSVDTRLVVNDSTAKQHCMHVQIRYSSLIPRN
jgi:hypothetical protein